MRKGFLSTALLCVLTLTSSCQRYETNAPNEESFNSSTTEAYVDACVTLVLNLRAAIEHNPKPLTSFTEIDSLSAQVYDNLSIETKSNLLNNPLTLYPETRATDETYKDILLTAEDALASVEPHLISSDVDELTEAVKRYKSDECYFQLSTKNQELIDECFLMCYKLRDAFLPVITTQSNSTRMSPGDRMIWSESASQMNDCQRRVATRMIINSVTSAFKMMLSPISAIEYASETAANINEYRNCGR